MIWKALSATTALFLLTLGYYLMVPTDSNVLISLSNSAASLPGYAVAQAGFQQIEANAFAGLIAGIVIAIIAVIIYLGAAANADETTSYEGDFQ